MPGVWQKSDSAGNLDLSPCCCVSVRAIPRLHAAAVKINSVPSVRRRPPLFPDKLPPISAVAWQREQGSFMIPAACVYSSGRRTHRDRAEPSERASRVGVVALPLRAQCDYRRKAIK